MRRRKALERARGAIGIRDFRIHDLRRTAATQMAELGISPHTIAQILNHVSARQGTITSKVYVQYNYEREKRDALCTWAARLEAILAGKCSVNVHDFVPQPVRANWDGLRRRRQHGGNERIFTQHPPNIVPAICHL
jgi:Phage integrase family